ncbi:hypothetical protein ACHAWF_006000 [Thalassiosira exigua]
MLRLLGRRTAAVAAFPPAASRIVLRPSSVVPWARAPSGRSAVGGVAGGILRTATSTATAATTTAAAAAAGAGADGGGRTRDRAAAAAALVGAALAGSAGLVARSSAAEAEPSDHHPPPAPSASAAPRREPILPPRSEQISRLSSGREFDVLVVGGGATGSGVALDAASRGLDVALIERGDFGCETSSRSTKLIWAGIRYIATATSGLLRIRNLARPIDAIKDFASEFRMVSNCHKERRLLLENNPHLASWIPIAVPIDSLITWPPPFDHPLFAIAPMVLPLVFKFYDGLSGFTCPPSHVMGKARAERKFPQLASEDALYYSVFYEGSHNDARTATCIALTAAEYGASVSNYTEMIDVLRDDETGKASGVKVRDNVSGETFDVYAKSIVFAGGPFTDGMRKVEDPQCKPAVAAAAGTHIVLPGYYCSRGVGMLDINT